eukprot:Phypoly_transcript_02687.p1 GENE.Phypoly_transcript_02687~~Phypoly_transcript_02687.p1  ORF type:complete len:689 (+),score=104.40 Phypoly_transcript_02687:605-2671(+)
MVAPHPLDPLLPNEIVQVVNLTKKLKNLSARAKFMSLDLWEPSKSAVRTQERNPRSAPIPREARVEVIEANGEVFWGIVSLSEGKISEWHQVPKKEGQPAFQVDEHEQIEKIVKSDEKVRAAARKRGVEDPEEQLMVDCGSVGHFNLPYEEEGRRLCAALLFVRAKGDPTDNGYAHPLDGVIAIVDVNKLEVIAVEEHFPSRDPVMTPGNYSEKYIGQRNPLKPLEITQPEGPNFQVEGNHVTWADSWDFRVGFNAREGLVLHDVRFLEHPQISPASPSSTPAKCQTCPAKSGNPACATKSQNKPDLITRHLFFRASMCEMTVPYGDPRAQHYRKNAFDAGEYGMGRCANSLKLGCDCKGYIHYFDAAICDSKGNPIVIKNAICMHEEDYGILWKHVDWRTGETVTRRSRRLVVSFFTTVANYEYGFYWYMYLDGSMHFEVKLTGIVNTGTEDPDPAKCPPWGTYVGPDGLYALFHQHYFCVRLQTDIDGDGNSIYEINYASYPEGKDNPKSNAFTALATLLDSEEKAKRRLDLAQNRRWKIVNPNKINKITGTPVGYIIEPGGNTVPYARTASPVYKRANYITNHLWVTPYHPQERYPTGNFPNQHPGHAGLPDYTSQNRSITNTDLVVWYVMGVTHDPRPEDWPVMPCAYLGVGFKPHGFFTRNPSIDVAAERSSCNTSSHLHAKL